MPRQLTQEEFEKQLEIRGFPKNEDGKQIVVCYPVQEAYNGYLRGLGKLEEAEDETHMINFLEKMKEKGYFPHFRPYCRTVNLFNSIDNVADCLIIEDFVFIGITPKEEEWQCVCRDY